MRRLPPLAAIRAFEAAARTENFTAAAAELGMTQAAVSYQVKSLEERLGAPLFVRERGRARLTPVDDLPESKQVRLDRLYPGAIWKQGERTLLVPLPAEGTNLPSWLCELLTGILAAPDAPALPDPGRPEQRRAAS